MTVTIRHGFAAADRAEVGRLYWQAFGGKLGRVLRPEAKAISFIDRVLRADHALSAYDANGVLLGVAGYKSPLGALVGGRFSDLRAVYGFFGAHWRALLLALLERDTENKRFLMDGIFVRAEARGRGVGSALLTAICDEAQARGYAEVRLDVIDSNDRARALYLRHGFRDVATTRTGLLGLVFGFESAITMVRTETPTVSQTSPSPAPPA